MSGGSTRAPDSSGPRRIDFAFSFFPQAWDEGVAERVFSLLVGVDSPMPAARWGNEGREKLPDDPTEAVAWLTDRYASDAKQNRMALFTEDRSPAHRFDLLRSEWSETSTFGQKLHWPKKLHYALPVEVGSTTGTYDRIVQVAKLTDCPLVTADYFGGWETETITTSSRREMSRVVQGLIHGMASSGPWRGLDRIPWRLLLGPAFVAMIGTDRLAALPDGAAIDHGDDVWSLQTTVEPAASISESGRAAERSIIEQLGPEFFADTAADRLAAVVPDFPAGLVPDDARLFEKYGESLKPL